MGVKFIHPELLNDGLDSLVTLAAAGSLRAAYVISASAATEYLVYGDFTDPADIIISELIASGAAVVTTNSTVVDVTVAVPGAGQTPSKNTTSEDIVQILYDTVTDSGRILVVFDETTGTDFSTGNTNGEFLRPMAFSTLDAV